MRIVHCANFNQIRLKGCYLASMGYKLTQGLIRLGHQVICYSDRDMSRAFGILGKKTFLSEKLSNENFINFCLNIAPDALILGHADTILPQTLLKIKESLPKLKILQWNVDCINPQVLASGLHNINNIKSKLPVVDFTLITTADKRLLKEFDPKNNAVGFIPNPVDKSIETARVFENVAPQYELFFAAGKETLRDFAGVETISSDVASYLKKSLPAAKLFFPKITSPALDGAAYLNALKESAMVLNLSRTVDYLYSSDRMAHAMGNGCLALIDRRTGFADLFAEEDACFYEQKEELVEKIKFYLANPLSRCKVAENGWRRYHELFNETLVSAYVASLLDETFNAKDYPFPTLYEENKNA